MACPMRFVLVGISLVVAWFAWWRCQVLEEEEGGSTAHAHAHAAFVEPQQEQERKQQQPGQPLGGKAQPQSAGGRLWAACGTFLDMFSGRYLYRAAVHGIDGGAPLKAR